MSLIYYANFNGALPARPEPLLSLPRGSMFVRQPDSDCFFIKIKTGQHRNMTSCLSPTQQWATVNIASATQVYEVGVNWLINLPPPPGHMQSADPHAVHRLIAQLLSLLPAAERCRYQHRQSAIGDTTATPAAASPGRRARFIDLTPAPSTKRKRACRKPKT
jgi:hypothetical protein